MSNNSVTVRMKIPDLIAPTFYDVWNMGRRCECDELWLHGGRGSGKSSFISMLIIRMMMDDRDANAIVYRKVADTLRESVYTQIAWAIDMMGLSELFQLKLSPLEIIFMPTRQRILFRGADKPEKSKGVKLQRGYFKCLWFEELTEFSDMNDVRTIKASILRGSDKPTMTFYSYNPPMSFTNWVNEECKESRKGRIVHKSSYLEIPENWIGDAFLQEAEALRLSNELLYRHMYLGEITGAGEQVFSEFVNAPEKGRQWTHVIEPFNPPKSWKRLRSYDWGFNRPFSCAWWVVDHDGVLYRILEDYGCSRTPNKGVRMNDEEQFAEIAQIEREHPYLAGDRIEGVADPSIWSRDRGPSIADVAERYGVYFGKGDNARIPGWMQVHYRLRFDEDGYPMMYFFKNCEAAIRTLPLMVYDERKPEDVDTETEDHAPDEIRYMCMRNPMNPPKAEPAPRRLPGPLDTEKTMDRYEFYRGRV